MKTNITAIQMASCAEVSTVVCNPLEKDTSGDPCNAGDLDGTPSIGYEHLGQLFNNKSGPEQPENGSTHSVDSCEFPSRPSLEVLITLERIFNHRPIDRTSLGEPSKYHRALLIWFYSLPKLGLASVTSALKRFLLPHVWQLSRDTIGTETLTPNSLNRAILYLQSLCPLVDSSLANLVYGSNWKRFGIGQHPLFAMASATVLDRKIGQSWAGIELLQAMFCDLVMSFPMYWQINQRDTSALANATRLALDLTHPNWKSKAVQHLRESVIQSGGWSSLAANNWQQWLAGSQANVKTTELFELESSGKATSPFAIYLESALKVLSARSIVRRQRNSGHGGSGPTEGRGFEEFPIDPEPVFKPDESESWFALLPAEDEQLDEEEDDAVRFFPAVQTPAEPDDPDSMDRPKTHLGIELPIKIRAKTMSELQAQSIASTYKLQATERSQRKHENDADVLNHGEFEILYNEIFKSPSQAVLAAANGSMNDIRWVFLACAFLGLNENQMSAMQVVDSKDVKHLRALCDALRVENRSADVHNKQYKAESHRGHDGDVALKYSHKLAAVNFPAPFFERLTRKSADVSHQMRIHVPTFDPDPQGKGRNVRWLVYTITSPKVIGLFADSSDESKFQGSPSGVLANGILHAKAVFDVINSHRLTRLSFAKLSKVFKRFVSLHLPEGATVATYLFGNLRTGGESSSIYSRYSTHQLQQIFQRGLDEFFSRNKWLDRGGLTIDLSVNYDRKTGEFECVGSSRVPDDAQIKALVRYGQDALITAWTQGAGSWTWQFMQAWSDYLLIWYLCITGERANDNALASNHFIDEVTGWVYSYSKTDNRCSGSTCFFVTESWLEQALRFIAQSRMLRLVRASSDIGLGIDWIDGERPSKARDMLQFERTLFSKAPLWIDWKVLFDSGKIVHLGVARRMSWLWTKANPHAKAMLPWRGNESRHYFASKARQAGIQNEAITAWMAHWVNGQSPYRSTASYHYAAKQFKSLLEFQARLERDLGFQSWAVPLPSNLALICTRPGIVQSSLTSKQGRAVEPGEDILGGPVEFL